MEPKEWYDKKLKTIERSLGYRLETIILNLTEKICKKMEEKNVNRSKLAELLNVSPPAVTKILNGTSNFTLKTLLSLADALELELEIDLREKARDVGYFQVVTAQDYGFAFEETADFAFGSEGFWMAGSSEVVNFNAQMGSLAPCNVSGALRVSISGTDSVVGFVEKTAVMVPKEVCWAIYSQKDEDQQAV